MSVMATLKLNCLIRGEDREHIFSIKIADDKTVYTLKEFIKDKMKNAFKDVDAANLILWKVSIAIAKDIKNSVDNTLFEDNESLMPDEELADVFRKESPDPKHVHIIVNQPLDIVQPALISGERLIELNCLILGDPADYIFLVKIGNNKTVDTLKDFIKDRVRPIFDHVPAHTLVLWKVSISVDKLDTEALDQLLKKEESLKPIQLLSDVFPNIPDRTQLHVVVMPPPVRPPDGISPERPFKRPRLDNSPPHTPPPKMQAGTVEAKSSPPRLTRQETETKMAAALAGFEKYIEYLATGELDGHLDSIRPEDKLSKFGMELPLNPILLIHDLGKHTDQERIKELFERSTRKIVHLFSVSGSGKTRLSLDGLCSHWGLYISCRTMTDTASGSNDFKVATDMLQSMSDWRTSSPDLSNNGSVAHRAFAMLLCARVFILKQLVQHFPVNTKITDARRRWVLAQVLPPRLILEKEDLFVKVLQVLRGAETEPMCDIISDSLRDIMTKRTDLFPNAMWTPLFIVIDEAQVAAEYLKFFRSAAGTERRPVLRDVVDFCQSTQIFNKIILSGTGLSMEMAKAAVGSLSAKEVPNESQGVFTNVGCFTREDSSQETYIRRYLTLSDNDSDKRLLERMKYWFSGRYRLTASLVEIFLHSENVPRHRVLTLFAEHLTGFKITDAIELEAGEPPISPDLDEKVEKYRSLTELGRLFKEEGLSNRMQMINCLTDALMRWTLGSELTSIPIKDKMHEMIALGVGFLDKMPHSRALKDVVDLPVYIFEPLVVLSLRSLFEQQRWTTMKEWMVRSFRSALNSSSLEMALPLVLMETFGGKFSALEEAFLFKGGSLGSRRVTLVSLKRVAGGEMEICPVSWNEGSSDRLCFKAKTHTDVLRFLDNPQGKVFLFPDNHMRPDLLWFFQDEDTKELIIGIDAMAKLNAGTREDAVDSVTPEFFYINQQSASNSRKTPRFLRIISTPEDKGLDGKDDLVVLRWDQMQKYIGSTADSVVNTIGSVVL